MQSKWNCHLTKVHTFANVASNTDHWGSSLPWPPLYELPHLFDNQVICLFFAYNFIPLSVLFPTRKNVSKFSVVMRLALVFLLLQTRKLDFVPSLRSLLDMIVFHQFPWA